MAPDPDHDGSAVPTAAPRARIVAGPEQVRLTVLETTDIHANITPYDYYSDTPTETVGLARTATHIRAMREENPNTLLFDNGDFLQGNPMGDFVAYEQAMSSDETHPVIAAMNAAGVDAATLGNHEFNYGLDFLMAALSGATFPVVSANVVVKEGEDPTGDETLLPPYQILERTVLDGSGNPHVLRIGVIGVVPPQIMDWDGRHLRGRVTTRDSVRAVEAWLPRMRAEGADIIIALNHSGIGAAVHTEGMENAAIPLAELDGIDAILTGHSHLVFPGPDFAGMPGVDAKAGTIGGKPGVMAGSRGSHLGVIDLLLDHDGDRWRVADHASDTLPIARMERPGRYTALADSDGAVSAAVETAHRRTLEYVRRPVGHTSAPIFSHFALVVTCPSVQIVSRAQRWFMEQLLYGSDLGSLPLLSATAPFKTGGRGGPEYYTDMPAGYLAIKNIADLYFYPNTIRAVKVNGAQLQNWLERSAGIYNQIPHGAQDALLLHPDFPAYNFDVIDGVTYEIDLSQPSRFGPKGEPMNPQAQRIDNLCYNGAPVTPEMEFVVATNNFRAAGGGSFPGAEDSTTILENPETVRDILIRYVVEKGTIEPTPEPNWRLKPMPGTTVLYETGPAAEAYLKMAGDIEIELAGDGPEGFARFRIHL